MKVKLPGKLFVLLMAVHFTATAQHEEEPKKGFDKDKLFFGGNFGLSFGDYTLINVSPQVGYRFNQYLAAGAGLNFIYSSIRYRYYPSTADYKNNYGVAGMNIFGRVYPIEFALLQLQLELNYTWGKVKFYDGTPDAKLPGKMILSLLGGAVAVIPSRGGAFIV